METYKINLELPLKYGTKISGHICQGHIDTVAKVKNIKKITSNIVIESSKTYITQKLNTKENINLISKSSSEIKSSIIK